MGGDLTFARALRITYRRLFSVGMCVIGCLKYCAASVTVSPYQGVSCPSYSREQRVGELWVECVQQFLFGGLHLLLLVKQVH